MCEEPSDIFKVKVICNPKHYKLCIGFTDCESSLLCWIDFEKKSWLISTGEQRLVVSGKYREKGILDIPENAVVIVSKDYSERDLVFKVEGKDINDKHGKPYGRIKTGLNEKRFKSLVGAVEMFWKNDEIEIVN